MRPTSKLLVYFVLLLATLSSVHGQSPTPDGVLLWLGLECDSGEEGGLQPALQALGVTAQPALIQAAQNGPNAGSVLVLMATFGEEFDETQNWILANGAQLGMTLADIQAAQNTGRDQYISQQVSNAVLAYKS